MTTRMFLPRRLIDLPPEQEGNFQPNSFMPRKFLERFREAAKKEIKPCILAPPPNVAGYESDGYFRRPVTWAMIMERRRQRQRIELQRIEDNYDFIYRKPLYVWVFWCPGINNFIFRGWWLYLIGLHISEALDFRGYNERLISEITTLFPLVEKPLFDPLDLKKWKAEFVRHYQRGTWGGKPQGKSLVWAEIKSGRVERILNRAEAIRPIAKE